MPVDHTVLQRSDMGTAAVGAVTSGRNAGGDDIPLAIRGESTVTLSSASGEVDVLENMKVSGAAQVTSGVTADPDNDPAYTKGVSWTRNTSGPSVGGDGGSYWTLEGGQMVLRRLIDAAVAKDPITGALSYEPIDVAYAFRVTDAEGFQVVKFQGTSASAVPIGSTAEIVTAYDLEYDGP